MKHPSDPETYKNPFLQFICFPNTGENVGNVLGKTVYIICVHAGWAIE